MEGRVWERPLFVVFRFPQNACHMEGDKAMTHSQLRSAFILWAATSLAVASAAQTGSVRHAGSPAVSPEVKHDVSPPLWKMAQLSVGDAVRDPDQGHEAGKAPAAPNEKMSTAGATPAAVLQTKAPIPLAATLGLNFDGVPGTNYKAPDTNGTVGATQYVQWVNIRYAVFDKATGRKLLGPLSGANFWAGFGGPCQSQNQGDIIAEYDKAAGRWVVTHRASQTGGPYLECVAVSVTSDATGSYYRYAFANPFNDFFTDYLKIAVWPDGYYFSTDLQDANNHFKLQESMVCAFERSNMLLGKTATEQCFLVPSHTIYSLLPADLDGATAPPAGSPNYFVNLDKANQALDFWQFHVNWTTPADSTFTGPTILPVATFTEACLGGQCIPQPGTAQKVDSLGDRILYRLAYRNFGSYESLLVTHGVNAGRSVGVRWYEIRNPEGNPPTVYQQGTYAPDSNFRWMPSIAQDNAGNIAVGYSVSSPALYPAIRFTGRVPTDPLGTLEAEGLIKAGNGSELPPDWRWGDYTAMTVDPADDCTFWYTNEYYSVSSEQGWRTRIANFKFPSCP